MNLLASWLAAGALVVVAAGIYLAVRAYRALLQRLDAERRNAQQVSELHIATIEALALAINAKDRTAHNHIRRVQAYATGLARALDLPEDEVQAVRTAALLHDIGELAVPEHILAKPGALTAEEFQKVRIHPQVGANIIAAVPFPYPVAPLILSHHERWDGRGYPDGLRGDAIPRGARIVAIAEFFDALTSNRPYHKAMTVDAASALIRQEGGRALDPDAVNTFLSILPELRASVEREMAAMPAPSTLGFNTLEPPEADTDPARSVLDDIAGAHREIYALYQIAQTMGTSLGVADTTALIASKLADLVPFSACALFLYSEADDMLSCRFATGTDSELIQQLTLRSGQGLTGWVARNRRPLVNARPDTDLEAAGSTLGTALQSALVCPLIVNDRLIGTLAVYHTTPSFYREDHRRLLDRICEQASAVIHNAMVFEKTQEASLTDTLTGLPNTRFMLTHLTRELIRAERQKTEVSLLVMDLNDFKEINDTYGHHSGDRALREVAHVLRTTIRPYDTCVRYAGDEFIVVIPGCGFDEAENRRRELQDAVDRIHFEGESGRPLKLSISAGTAVFPHDGHTYEQLLTLADARMYQDKSARKQHARLARGTSEVSPAGRTSRAVS